MWGILHRGELQTGKNRNCASAKFTVVANTNCALWECLEFGLLVFKYLELQFVLPAFPVAAAGGKAEVLGVFRNLISIWGWGQMLRGAL